MISLFPEFFWVIFDTVFLEYWAIRISVHYFDTEMLFFYMFVCV